MRLCLIFMVLVLTLAGYVAMFESLMVWSACSLFFIDYAPNLWNVFYILLAVNLAFFGVSIYSILFKE